MTLDQIPRGTQTLITVTPHECTPMLDYGLVFSNVSIHRSGPNCKNNGLPNNLEPSVTLLQKHLNINESGGNRTDVCVQFTNRKATCFNVGCARKSKGFSTEHK